MALRFMLTSLLLVRLMLGPACGGNDPADQSLHTAACQARMAEAACCCCDNESIACELCGACEGRLPPIEPTNLPSPVASDWLLPPILPEPEMPAGGSAADQSPAVASTQSVPRVPWIERLRPIVCVWVI